MAQRRVQVSGCILVLALAATSCSGNGSGSTSATVRPTDPPTPDAVTAPSVGATSTPGPSPSDPPTIAATTDAPAAKPAFSTPGSLNTGCIDQAGTKTGRPDEWYRDDASGVVTLDIGELRDDPTSAEPLADILASFGTGAGQIDTWEFVSDVEPFCAIGRGAAVLWPDGSQLRLSVWRLSDAVKPGSVPHHAPFVIEQPELLVSDGSAAGDITALRVLPDGTTIKVVALGVDAFGFAGWPTTTVSRPDQVPRPPRQTIDDAAAIADRVVETLDR